MKNRCAFALLTTLLFLAFTGAAAPSSDKTKLVQTLSNDSIHALLKEQSAQTLVDHLRTMLENNQAEAIARELLILTRGLDWQTEPAPFLSTADIKPNGNKDYKHAHQLGLWLGSFRLASDEQRFDSKQASALFNEITMMIAKLSSSKISDSPINRLSHDIAQGRVSLNEAIELLAYGDVTASSVTRVIGQGIRAVQRRMAD